MRALGLLRLEADEAAREDASWRNERRGMIPPGQRVPQTSNVRRLEAHLALCDRCRGELRDHRGVKSALGSLRDGRAAPDPARVARLRPPAQRLSHGQGGR